MTISKTVQIEKKTKQESDEKASDVTQKEPEPRVWMVRIFCIVISSFSIPVVAHRCYTFMKETS
jgi:hypothetical protein